MGERSPPPSPPPTPPDTAVAPPSTTNPQDIGSPQPHLRLIQPSRPGAPVVGAIPAQAQAIAAYLGQTEPESVEKMTCRLAKLERQVKALILTQTS